MLQMIEAKVPPKKVWEAWERAHQMHGQKGIQSGVQGERKTDGKKGFHYQILDVTPGESFSILWKTFFVRLVFTHTVKPSTKGSQISYQVQIRGPFAWPVRWILGNKIRQNIAHVLQAIVKQLENE